VRHSRTPIRPITGRPSLAPTSLTPLPSGSSLTGDRPLSLWEQGGLPRSVRAPLPKDLGPTLPPAVKPLRGGKGRSPDLTAYLFGSCLPASLACFLSRRLTRGLPRLALSFNPSSRPPRGWPSQLPLTVRLLADSAKATGSRTLRTPGLPPTHGPVGYPWQNTGSTSLINTRTTSCRTSPVGVPVVSYRTNITTRRGQGQPREGLSGGSLSAKARADGQKPPRRLSLRVSQHKMTNPPRCRR
jgi:hypothetical protein